jgi:hypothetical protein
MLRRKGTSATAAQLAGCVFFEIHRGTVACRKILVYITDPNYFSLQHLKILLG